MTDLEKPADFGNFSRFIQVALTTFARASHKVSSAPWEHHDGVLLGGRSCVPSFLGRPRRRASRGEGGATRDM